MGAYSGKYEYLDERGATLAQGACQVTIESETCTVAPADGAAIAFDLGDVEALAPGDWGMGIRLWPGRSVLLRQFGKAFGEMAQALTEAWRERTIQCLLLEDLDEVARFSCAVGLNGAAPTAAELRLFKSNIAVLPVDDLPTQWRLAEIDAVRFDEASYSVVLEAGGMRMTVAKLAKRTDEFRQKLNATLEALHTESANALRQVFPFLNADQLRRTLGVMAEGRSARLSQLEAIHKSIPEALIERAVDEPLRPYFEALRARADAGSIMAGFKFTSLKDEEDESEPAPETDGEEQPLFFWFFFPIAGTNVAAWEASTGSGRATYFFRTTPPVDAAITQLARGLALVNFRREPVYLSGESLERQPRYRRYAIGCRKLPDLAALRRNMLGRAIHTSLETWSAQLDAALR